MSAAKKPHQKMTMADLGLSTAIPMTLTKTRQEKKMDKVEAKKERTQRIKAAVADVAAHKTSADEHREFIVKQREEEKQEKKLRQMKLKGEHIKAQKTRAQIEKENETAVRQHQQVLQEEALVEDVERKKREAEVQAKIAADTAERAAAAPRAVFVPVQRTPEIEEVRQKLPVLAEEQPIVEAVMESNGNAVLVCGETGSGKTTQVPQFLWEAGFGKKGDDASADRDGMIAVTEPRRVAAISMARRVAEELNEEFGTTVCYHVRYQNNLSPQCKLKFMTEGILLKELQSDFLLRKYSAIVIDEAHERSVACDVLVGLLSRVVPLRQSLSEENGSTVKPLKLIIMSATLRISDFRDNARLFSRKPDLIKVDVRRFPVTTHYARRTELHKYCDEAFYKVRQLHKKLPPGGVLIFLSTQREIEMLCERLTKHYKKTRIVYDDSKYTKHSLIKSRQEGAVKKQAAAKKKKADAAASKKKKDKKKKMRGPSTGSSDDEDDAAGSGEEEEEQDEFGLRVGDYALDGDADAPGADDDAVDPAFASFMQQTGLADDFDYGLTAGGAKGGKKKAAKKAQGDEDAAAASTKKSKKAKKGKKQSSAPDWWKEDDNVNDIVWSSGDEDDAAALSSDDEEDDEEEGEEVEDEDAAATAAQDQELSEYAAAVPAADASGAASMSKKKKFLAKAGKSAKGSKDGKRERGTENENVNADGNDDEDSDEDGEPIDAQEIEDEDEEDGAFDTLHVLPLYSLLDQAKQQLVFDAPPPGKRLCVIATNIAETSITIPNIRYVVDAGRVKNKLMQEETGAQTFKIEWISQAAAEQRSGRAGRVGPGHCYRLYSTAVYANWMPEHTAPEMLRTPLESVVLMMKHMKIDHVGKFPFPSAPPMLALRSAMAHLRRIGGLDAQWRCTALGGNLVALPLPPRFAKMIFTAATAVAGLTAESQKKVIEAIVTASCVASTTLDLFVQGGGENPQLLPRKQVTHAGSDFITCLRVFNIFAENPSLPRCRQLGIVHKSLQEAAMLRRQVSTIVAELERTAAAAAAKPPAQPASLDEFGTGPSVKSKGLEVSKDSSSGIATTADDEVPSADDDVRAPLVADFDTNESVAVPTASTAADADASAAKKTRGDAAPAAHGRKGPLQIRDAAVSGKNDGAFAMATLSKPEEMAFRKLLIHGLIDQVCRRASVAECRAAGLPYADHKTSKTPYFDCLRRQVIFVHPQSSIAATHPPPEWVVYSVLVKNIRTAEGKRIDRTFMRGCTIVTKPWLDEVGFDEDAKEFGFE